MRFGGWPGAARFAAARSIITACAVMTHANMLKEDRLKVGITDGFIRISCGIEEGELGRPEPAVVLGLLMDDF
eukprot:Skav205445  [mRNA]  locus=scaffold2500:548904:551063:- [translate_table: standard]